MLGYIKGSIITKHPDYLIINNNNLGYQIRTNTEIIANTELEQEVELFLYAHIKEDAQDLYGFKTFDEKLLFETIISVSGIGPKTGLMLLSVGSSKQISNAIEQKDTLFFTQVPGIGKKTANRLILELQDKLEDTDLSFITGDAKQEALSALLSLGYQQAEAQQALAQIQGETAEEQVREALKVM